MSDTQPAVGNDNEAANVVVRGGAAGFAQEIFAGLHLRRDRPLPKTPPPANLSSLSTDGHRAEDRRSQMN
jgi:hypothetical protein